ncbi:MAG: HAD-IA family hydrolase [Rhodospirillales bacterium]|nr:HAD-IA family hydrolase [Rhodospirillales bacterium]
MSLRALIFDVDGTLAETEEAHRRAFNESFRDRRLDWQWDRALYRRLLDVTGGKERIRHYMACIAYDPGAGGDALVRDLHLAKNRHYAKLVAAGHVSLRPGIRRVIAQARQTGIRLAIATTTSPESVERLLVAAFGPESPGWFDAIAAGDAVAAKKPAPDVYQLALRQLGLATQECLALEDSENGLRAALAAGLKTVVTVSTYTDGQDFSGAAIVLSDLGEPEHPFRVLAGDAFGGHFADCALLQRWHETAPG